MAVQYLLPCACGRETVVQTTQAGEAVQCECGLTLQVPTLLEMSSLDPAPVESVAGRPPAPWGGPQRLVLLGVALAAAAIAGGLWLYITRPVSRFTFDPEQVLWSARNMPPATTWENWQMVKQGLDRRVDREFEVMTGLFHIQEGIAAAVLGIGLVVTLAGVVWMKLSGPRRVP